MVRQGLKMLQVMKYQTNSVRWRIL